MVYFMGNPNRKWMRTEGYHHLVVTIAKIDGKVNPYYFDDDLPFHLSEDGYICRMRE